MHAFFFGLKRAWHSSLRISRHAFAALGLTAARFDLLYAVHHRPQSSISQSDLRRQLGVSRTTVSRMLASLEELGLVQRTREYPDRRTRLVELTARGRTRIRVAIRRLIASGAAELAVDTALGGEHWHDERVTFGAMDALDGVLRGIRRAFRDFATLYYPWHPDD